MSHQTAQMGLFVSLAVTVVVLLAAMYWGHKKQLKAHLAGVGVFLVVFLVTVFFAEMLGRHYSFTQPSFGVHLTVAILTSLGTVAPLLTGHQHWKGKATLRAHRLVVSVWLVGIIAAVGTGMWMLTSGQLNEPAEATRSE